MNVRKDQCLPFVIFICGNFRLTAATTAACSGFPELLAKASRACAASGIGYFLVLFSTKSDFGSFFLAAVVSLAIDDDSPLGRTSRNFCSGLPIDSVHPKLTEQEATADMSKWHSSPPPRSRRRSDAPVALVQESRRSPGGLQPANCSDPLRSFGLNAREFAYDRAGKLPTK